MIDTFTQLAIVVVAASFLGILGSFLRQPTMVAYLFAGLLVGYFGFFDLAQDETTFRVFADLGIMFLLFLVGLEINYASLRVVGRDAIVIGFGQIIFTFLAGLLVARALSFEMLHAVYISIALTFSSTIIVVNILSAKKDLNNLYGRLSVGMLLVQDFVAVVVLMLVVGLGGAASPLGEAPGGGTLFARLASFFPDALRLPIAVAATILAGFLVVGSALWLSRAVIPRIFEHITRSTELIFLTSVAWLFTLTAAVDLFGFSKEIGGFLAGVTLANSYEHFQIAHRLKPLRDFFMLVFFVILGTSLFVYAGTTAIAASVVVFSLLVLVGNPFIVFVLMALLGHKRRIAFLTGVTFAQISEFSLILAVLGLRFGHIPPEVVTLITAVGVVTIAVSTYLIVHAQAIFTKLSPYLAHFERRRAQGRVFDEEGSRVRRPVVIVGFHRTGQSLALALPKDDLLIIDYDPVMIKKLQQNKLSFVFGDMIDDDVLGRIDWSAVRVVISTAPDLDSNAVFLEVLLRTRQRFRNLFKIVIRARTEEEARILYEAGADYVLLPHFTAGRLMARLIASDPYLKGTGELRERDQKHFLPRSTESL